MDIFKKIALASIGALDITRTKLEEMFDELVKRGEMTEDQRAEAVRKFVEKSGDSAEKIKHKVEELFASCAEKCAASIESRHSALEKKIADLQARIDELSKNQA